MHGKLCYFHSLNIRRKTIQIIELGTENSTIRSDIFALSFQGIFVTFDDDKIYTYVYCRETVNGRPDFVTIPSSDNSHPASLVTDSKWGSRGVRPMQFMSPAQTSYLNLNCTPFVQFSDLWLILCVAQTKSWLLFSPSTEVVLLYQKVLLFNSIFIYARMDYQEKMS